MVGIGFLLERCVFLTQKLNEVGHLRLSIGADACGHQSLCDLDRKALVTGMFDTIRRKQMARLDNPHARGRLHKRNFAREQVQDDFNRRGSLSSFHIPMEIVALTVKAGPDKA